MGCKIKLFKNVYFLIFVLSVFSACNKSKNDDFEKNYVFDLKEIDLIYYPSFSNPLGVHLDFDKTKIKIFGPDFYTNPNNIVLEPFEKNIKKSDLILIESILKNITCDELEFPQISFEKDGLHLECVFVYNDGSLFTNTPGNCPQPIYNTLKDSLINIVLRYNESETNKELIMQIKEYR